MEPLAIVKRWVAPYVGESGKNEADPDVLDAINEARRIIYPLGNWLDTMSDLVVQVYGGTVTLPFWADCIVSAWNCKQVISIENTWYHQIDRDTDRFCGAECFRGMIDLGARFASFRDSTRPFRLKVIPWDDRDKDTVLTFHGISEYGEPVLLTRVLQTAWVPITSGPPNDKWIKRFSYCQKPKTHDRIQVFMWDIVRNTQDLCAIYEAGDVNPNYRRYRVSRSGRNQIVAQVKKKYIELTDDRELVDIHTDALIHLLQGITARRNRDTQTYAQQVKSARDFLDKEIAAKKPIQTQTLKMSDAYRVTNLGFED